VVWVKILWDQNYEYTGQYIPITVLVVLTLTLIEAAGAAEYRKLPGIDQKQQFSAKIMQVCNRLIKTSF
jgi:hypothetical protein